MKLDNLDEAANALSLARDKLLNAVEDMPEGELETKVEAFQTLTEALYEEVENFLTERKQCEE